MKIKLHQNCCKNVHHFAKIPKQWNVEENNITQMQRWTAAIIVMQFQHFKVLN
jgi:hypothetical protein